MPKMKIKKGDEVIVMSGKDIGVKGRVLEVIPKDSRVIVEGVNRVTRHERIRPSRGRGAQEGGIMHKEAPISVSNVQLVSPGDGKPTRVAYRIDPNSGAKQRICKRTGVEF